MVFCDFDRFQTAFLSGMAGGVMLRLPALVLLYNAAHGKSIQLAGGAACAGAGSHRRARSACFNGAIAHANAACGGCALFGAAALFGRGAV